MPLGTEVGLGFSLRDTVFAVDPATPRQKGTPTPTQFLTHTYCGQTAGGIKMSFGTEINVGSGDVVLDGVAAHPLKGAQAPSFRFTSIVANRLDG